MIETEYIRNLNCNYQRVLLGEKPEEKRYQYCILTRGGIKGLLPCSLRYINGQAYLYYDISSRQNMVQLFQNRCVSRAWLLELLWSMRRQRLELERFLLDFEQLIWYPEHIFQELDTKAFSFLFFPYCEEKDSFRGLLEFLTEHIDYEDEELVEFVYHAYEQYEKSGAVYLQEQLFADAEELSAGREQKEPEPVVTQTEEVRSDDSMWNTAEQPQRQEAGWTKEQPQRQAMGQTKEQPQRQAAGQMKEQPQRLEAERIKEQPQRQAAEEGEEQNKGRNQEQKHGWMSLFDGKKKKHKEQREILRQQSHYAMQGSAVAEETLYNAEEEYGATVCLEMPESMQERIRGLYLPDGTLLCSLDRPVITIGKMKEESEVVLEDSSISRMHCRIVKEKEYYYLEDLNSTNGTFKNGVRLQPCEKRRLEEGDDIRCGRVLFVFR